MAISQSAFPRTLSPMLATSCAPFDDPGFLFDIKWDGVRAMASKSDGQWSFWGRNTQDYTPRYPELCDALQDVPDRTILDGELVIMRDNRPDFHALMSEHRGRSGRRGSAREPVAFVIFDMPYSDGRSLLRVPLAERRALLRVVLSSARPPVLCCDGVVGKGIDLFRQAIAAGHEGIVAKRLNSPYIPGKRNDAWRKIKQSTDIPCVVIGYRVDGSGLRDLLLATMQDGSLSFCGAVDLGLSGSKELLKRLATRHRRTPVLPCSMRAQWVEPQLFCVIRSHGWRPSGVWRDPVFVGWADDSQKGNAAGRG